MDRQGVEYFHSQALEVVCSGPAGLPSDQQAIEPDQLYNWIRSHVPASADSVFVGGNGFRAIGVIKALEDSLNRPVLTANQVAFWCALRLTGARVPVTNYGRIFEFDLPPS
jgi:maleate isomerase